MVSFDWLENNKMLGLLYLEERLDKSDLTGRILDNLNDGIENDDVLKNHFDYCKRNKLQECLPFALCEIVNEKRDDDVRNISLDYLSELNEIRKIEEILPKVQDKFKWFVVESLLNHESEYAHNYLKDILKNGSNEDQIKASTYLIKLNDLNGLKYYVEWVKKWKKVPETLLERLQDSSSIESKFDWINTLSY